MQYATEVTIERPRALVVALFDDPENLPLWQDGLVSVNLVSGSPGEEGAVTNLVYEQKPGRPTTLTETVERNALPDEFIAIYEGSGAWNRHANYFREDGPDRTLYVTETEFKFCGIARLLPLLVGKAFRQETLRGMLAFKSFCELR